MIYERFIIMKQPAGAVSRACGLFSIVNTSHQYNAVDLIIVTYHGNDHYICTELFVHTYTDSDKSINLVARERVCSLLGLGDLHRSV